MIKTQSVCLGVLMAMLWLTACTRDAPERPGTHTSLQMAWLHNVAWAGIYLAQADGYYAHEDLAVDLRPLPFDAVGKRLDPLLQVSSGKADFGILDASVILEARAKGVPVVAIASLYQRHPVALISLAEKNIVRPQDLLGATIAVSPNSAVVYRALLAAQALDPARVHTVLRTDYTPAPLLRGEVDVIDAWITSEVVMLRLEGYKINVIFPSDYGVELYPSVIYTTEDMIAKHPERVERFLRATLRGIQGTLDNPAKAAGLTIQYNDTLDLKQTTEAMFLSVPLLKPAGSRPGMMHAEVWQTMYDILREQGILDSSFDVHAAYTLAFLERVYAP